MVTEKVKPKRNLSLKKFGILFFLFQVSFIQSYSQQPKLMFTFGHTDGVSYALFSPDGKKIVTASKDKTVKIWDAVSGNVLADLKGNNSIVYSENFSPNGKRIVTASFDSCAKVWDINSGEMLLNLKGHTDEVWGASYSPDGKRIATCSKDNTGKIWDSFTGKKLVDLTGHTSYIQTICFSPNGEKVATSSYDSTVRIWDSKSGKILNILKIHAGAVYSARFSPDGRYLVSASADSTSKIWDANSGKLLHDLKGHENQVWVAEFSSDNKKIVTADFDFAGKSAKGTVKLWNAGTGILISNLEGHHGSIWHAKFSPDNKKIITASSDQTLKIWDVTAGKIIFDITAHNAPVRTANFSPDGKSIVTGSDDKTAKVWDTNSGKLRLNLKGYASGLWSVQISPDGSKIITASGDNTAKIWDVYGGKIIHELKGHTDTVNVALFSPGGEKVLTVSKDGTAKLWNAEDGNLLFNLAKHTGNIKVAQFSYDGKFIATGSEDRTVKIWDANNGIFLSECKGHKAGIRSVEFGQNGTTLLSASIDGTAKIWDVSSGKTLREFVISDASDPAVVLFRLSAEFSPDEKKVVTLKYPDSTVQVWDANTGKSILTLEGHNERISTVKFSPDGSKLVTASWDKTAKIWDGETGKLLRDLVGHTFGLRSADFTVDGSRIITTSRDNSAKVWDVSSGELTSNLASRTAASWLDAEVETGGFSNNGEIIITASGKTAINVWDSKTAKLLYTFFTVGTGSDYLVVDKDGHFDGTEIGKKLLYITCGAEIITLEQVKDRLWVPGLAERIMRNDSIAEIQLSDLDICGYTPDVEEIGKGMNGYLFKITPRNGGLGETVLYLNNIEIQRYKISQLKKEGKSYMLAIRTLDLQDKFLSNSENILTVKSYSINNDISSRGIIVKPKQRSKDTTPPNLFAIMIGVSLYKNEDLNLTFPAQDAKDLGTAVDLSAKRLFGVQHVFKYDLTTNKDHYRHPGKVAIKEVILDVGRKAKPNDILLIFFAGHGITSTENKAGNKKQFYFLTADASLPSGALEDVGISTSELTNWINPAVMKAQKRILIFDACNSGNAINDILAKAGSFKVRDDNISQQIKAINKLNEQAGLFILSASASDQPAYEMSKYGHGLLTYALLRTIKLQQAIPGTDNLLDLSRWFSEGRDKVAEISRLTGARQQPQLLSSTNFPIGIVDTQVIASIKFSHENPIFSNSYFQNEAIADDDLDLNNYVNRQFIDNNSGGSGDGIIFNSGSIDPDAWTLSGNYKIDQDDVIVKTINIKQHKSIKKTFSVSGKKSNLRSIAIDIAQQASEWILKNNLQVK